MPSKDWFKENPKVSAYLSSDLYSRLEEFMHSRGIRKITQAMTVILEDYLKPSSLPVDQSNLLVNQISKNQSERLEALEGKLPA